MSIISQYEEALPRFETPTQDTIEYFMAVTERNIVYIIITLSDKVWRLMSLFTIIHMPFYYHKYIDSVSSLYQSMVA